MPSDIQTAPVSKKMLWTGRIMNALVVLFLLMDGVMKLFNPAPVVEGMTKLGYPLSLTAVIVIVLVVCVAICAARSPANYALACPYSATSCSRFIWAC